MSRIGRKPINIPAGVEVKIDGSVVTVKGPKGTLTQKVHPNMNVAVEGNEIVVTRPDDEKENRSLPMRVDHGMTMLGDETRGYNAGYSFLGRMFAMAQVQGVMAAVKSFNSLT